MMKSHTMLRYITKLIIILILSVGTSQENIVSKQNIKLEDSVKIEQKYGIRVGVDLSKQIRMLTEDYTGVSLYADLRIKERIFIVAELGNDDKRINNENLNSKFSGITLKLGSIIIFTTIQ